MNISEQIESSEVELSAFQEAGLRLIRTVELALGGGCEPSDIINVIESYDTLIKFADSCTEEVKAELSVFKQYDSEYYGMLAAWPLVVLKQLCCAQNTPVNKIYTDSVESVLDNANPLFVMNVHETKTAPIIDALLDDVSEYQAIFLERGSITRVLLEKYLEAWNSLIEEDMIPNSALQELWGEKWTNYHEAIARASNFLNVRIGLLTPLQVFNYLTKHELSFSHLNDKPLWYVAVSKVDGLEYRYFTRFFNDVMRCGGHSTEKEDLRTDLKDCEPGVSITHLKGDHYMQQRDKLLRTLSMPHMCDVNEIYLIG